MTVTNNIAQTRFFHYKTNGITKVVQVGAYCKLSLPDLTNISQVVFSSRDAHTIIENTSLGKKFVTTFTVA